MSEELPEGWKSEPLRNVAQVVSGGTPSRYVPEFWENGKIPWVTPTDITGSNGRYLSETRESITERGLQSCSARLLPPGTLLMTGGFNDQVQKAQHDAV
jgi:type I restriction enzyme S subunit